MQLKWLGQTLECENDLRAVERTLADVMHQVQHAQCYVHGFIVDGVHVYTNIFSYIAKHIKEIKTIEIVTMTREQYAEYAEQTVVSYVGEILPGVQQLADHFYNGASSSTWQQFDNFLQSLQLIHGAIEAWKDAAEETKKQQLSAIQTELQEKLQQMLHALEAGDVVLIGDLLCYEIGDVLEKVKSEG